MRQPRVGDEVWIRGKITDLVSGVKVEVKEWDGSIAVLYMSNESELKIATPDMPDSKKSDWQCFIWDEENDAGLEVYPVGGGGGWHFMVDKADDGPRRNVFERAVSDINSRIQDGKPVTHRQAIAWMKKQKWTKGETKLRSLLKK